MNKYKIISIVLALAFIVALVRSLAFSGEAAAPVDKVVFDNIMTRTSVREYADRPVRRTLLDSLARAGMAAPTALDMRPWKYVISRRFKRWATICLMPVSQRKLRRPSWCVAIPLLLISRAGQADSGLRIARLPRRIFFWLLTASDLVLSGRPFIRMRNWWIRWPTYFHFPTMQFPSMLL